MKNYIIIFFISFSIFSTSCMTTKTNVGKYREGSGRVYTYSKAKQMWLFWGIIPLGRTKTSTPSSGSCQVVTRFNFIDFLINGLTVGVLNAQTIKVNAKKEMKR